MAVEVATKIADLNKLWPLGTDPRSEGDDHIRLIKQVLLATDGGALTSVVLSVKTSSGTYTKPATLKFLEIWVVGGGGAGSRAGSSAAGSSSAGSGGGGGGMAYNLYAAAALAATEAYVVAAGGTAVGGVGGAGGNSTFKGLTAAGGGGGGALMSAVSTFNRTPQRGAGGIASGGTLNVPGGVSDFGYACMHGSGINAQGGFGGNSYFVPGFTTSPISSANAGGVGGTFPGGGGSGEGCGNGNAVGTGSTGAAGMIMLKEYF